MGLKVYTGGTFDLFHRGHVRLLRACARLGSVTVALNTDEFVQQFKGKPTCTYDERLEVLQACRYVDHVVCNTDGADSKPTIEEVRPDIILVGSDWASKDYHAQMGFTQDWLDERRILLLYHDYTKGISSTAIRGRL
jgi:glycerol-3-phosphate cytidylyltransferase